MGEGGGECTFRPHGTNRAGLAVYARGRDPTTCGRQPFEGHARHPDAAWAHGHAGGLSVPHRLGAGLVHVDEDGHVGEPKTGPPLCFRQPFDEVKLHLAGSLTIGLSVTMGSSNKGP